MSLDVPQTDFWNDRDKAKKHREFKKLKLSINGKDKYEEWINSICLTLPSIEHHLDGKAVAKMKEDKKWLEDLELSSASGWERLKEEFYKNGPAFLDVLDSFTDWKRIESQMAAIFDIRATRLIKVLLLACKNLQDLRLNLDDRSKQGRGDDILAAIASGISVTYKPNDLARNRVEDLLWKAEVVSSKAHQYGFQTLKDQRLIESRILSSIFQILWEERSYTLLGCWDLIEYFNNKLVCYRGYPLWCNYEQMIKTFVRQVGCAKYHKTPEENIAELRLFHSTTIGYFSELQAKYFKTELKLKELRRQITALEFRHLMEHLPDPDLDPHAGPRWTKFWDKALKDEAASHEARNAQEAKIKALKEELADREGHADQEVKKKELEELEEARTRDRKHALADIMEDRNPDRIHEEVTTQNATVAVEGARLYNKLSDEIHRYRGTEYRVGEPGDWDVAISDILKALKPENVKENGDVDWTKERERYVSKGTATDDSDEKAFSWNTAPMRKRINVLEKDKDQMQVDIGKLKGEIKDLKKVKVEEPDVSIGDLFE